MESIFNFLKEVITFLWPFRMVKQYETCVYYFNGRIRNSRWSLFSSAPGLKFVVPFFSEIETYTSNERVYTLPRQPITLQDGKPLTFRAVIVGHVRDAVAAELNVTNFQESLHEVASAELADQLSEYTSEQLEVKNRRRLLTSMRNAIQRRVATYGFEVDRVSFAQFVLPQRIVHVINDQGGSAEYT